ncbi:MAG TPA: hypothetical protein VLA66_14165 [Thermoanaerobaculia bacterium]|nr:hypothetical protein [Thermoanaerobaculia bacterium]
MAGVVSRPVARVWLALLCLGAPLAAQAPACTPELVGHDRRGPAGPMAVSGATLALGAGGSLVVFDVTDLLAPVELGHVDLRRLAADVAVWGDVAVVAGGSGLDFVDLSDPLQPQLAGAVDGEPSWSIARVAARDGFAYYPAPDGLHVVDFADPAAPAEVALFPAGDPRDVVVRGPRVYLLSAAELRVLDVSDPTAPVQRNVVDVPVSADERLTLAPSGSRLAATGGGRWDPRHSYASAAFFGLADPDAPRLRSTLLLDDEWIGPVAFSAGRVYLTDLVYDLTDLSQPVWIGRLPSPPQRSGLLPTSDPARLIVSDGKRGLLVEEVTDPPNAQVLASVPLRGRAVDGYVDGSLAVVAYDNGLGTFDLADPAHPAALAFVPLPDAWLDGVVRVGDRAYAASGAYPDYQLLRYDLSDPAGPIAEGSLPWHYGNRPVAATGVLAVRESCDEAVRLYDVADPGDPQLASEILFSQDCSEMDFTLDAHRLYWWEYVGGWPDYPQLLHVFDIADPWHPVELAATLTEEQHRGSSAVRGHFLLLAEWDHLAVVSVRDPAQPATVVAMPLPISHPGIPRRMTTYGPLALVSTEPAAWLGGEDDRVRVVDVSRPWVPLPVAALDSLGPSSTAFAGPNVIVLADGPGGIAVYGSCVPFADGFESGDVSAWSESQP